MIKKIVEICKRRGIIFPTAEIYGGFSGFFEYGPIGVLIKRKLENYWREYFVKPDPIFEIEGCLVLPEKVFEASGHLKDFVDPIAQCKKCKVMHRADHLIQDLTKKFVEGLGPEELTKIIKEKKLKCPKCKGELEDVRLFNLLLKTDVSPAGGETAYLRPETAQNMFINFKRIVNTTRTNLPFGIAQCGRSFRNEISPRQFIVRLKEFNQFEIEMFIDPKKLDDCPNFEKVADTKIIIYTREAQKENKKPIEITAREAWEKKIIPNKWMAYFLAKEFIWFQSLGIPKEALRFRHMLPEETPHYSKGNFDLEIKFEFGWKESVGNALRADYDLKQHAKFSKEDLSIVTSDGRKIIPWVVEPSFGVERPLAGVLYYCFREGMERGWSWFAFPPRIAPYHVGVFPLVNKDGLPEKAKEIYEMLKKCFDVFYDDKGSIGKRYARADEIGVPFGITIDYETLKNDSITIRDRNTTKQVRVKIKDLVNTLWKLINEEIKFEDLK
jgi:glycyl-tRNA synthetase